MTVTSAPHPTVPRTAGPATAGSATTGPATTGPATTAECGCPAGPASGLSSLTRRTVLKALGGAAITLMATESVHTQVALAAPGYTGDVLVVLSLRGGFDGLSAVVPAADPDYYRLRPTIGVPTSRLLSLDATFGLHPALAPLQPLWAAGQLAAVHGVGAPDPTRSHFQALEEMERAAPGTTLRTGWLDRTLGTRMASATTSPFTAVQVGSSTSPQSLAGPVPVLATSSLAGFSLTGPSNAADRDRWTTCLTTLHGAGPATIASAGRTALAATASIAAMPGATPAVTYPTGSLGASLAAIARMIKAGVGVQVATVDSGDWDMHSALGAGGDGHMATKLTELGAALAAFAADLGPAMSGVTLVTLSEFGRLAAENASGGLDHGHGNAMLVLGGGVKGGKVYGHWPGLAATALDGGALAGTTDYRAVIGEILTTRCGAGSISSVFPGLTSASTLGLTRAR